MFTPKAINFWALVTYDGTWENTESFASSTSFSENLPEQAHSMESWNTWRVSVEQGSL